MIVIGIDPGTPLTVAALSPDGAAVLGVWSDDALATQESRGKTTKWYNNPALLTHLLRPYATLGAHVVIEAVAPMPEQGVVSQCRFTGSMYLAQGVAAGLGMDATYVTPTKWKREMGLSADKEVSRARALTEWPGKAGLFKRKMDHNRAEAALLALWFIRNR
jgi:hypothetical protein